MLHDRRHHQQMMSILGRVEATRRRRTTEGRTTSSARGFHAHWQRAHTGKAAHKQTSERYSLPKVPRVVAARPWASALLEEGTRQKVPWEPTSSAFHFQEHRTARGRGRNRHVRWQTFLRLVACRGHLSIQADQARGRRSAHCTTGSLTIEPTCIQVLL